MDTEASKGIPEERASSVMPDDGLNQRIASMNRVLADATKECPENKLDFSPDEIHPRACVCKGTGRVAKFPGFRQECQCLGDGRYTKLGCPKCWYLGAHSLECIKCNGTGWQVHAGDWGTDGLAGLTVDQIQEVLEDLAAWIMRSDLAPDSNAIQAKCLELVIKVAELEVPDAVEG